MSGGRTLVVVVFVHIVVASLSAPFAAPQDLVPGTAPDSVATFGVAFEVAYTVGAWDLHDDQGDGKGYAFDGRFCLVALRRCTCHPARNLPASTARGSARDAGLPTEVH
jgi:hypothetical protein